MLRYLNPVKYWQRTRDEYFQYRYDAEREGDLLVNKFTEAGLDYKAGVQKLRQLGLYEPLTRFDSMASNHWILFAAISLKTTPINILEIGTYDAVTTELLATLFPKSSILTLDLPDDDPVFVQYYGRDSLESRKDFINKRNQILDRYPKITFQKKSSFFLPEITSEKFDLIWVDGAHHFPEVAWDICNAYHHLSASGSMMCDDIVLDPRGVRNEYVGPDAALALGHIVERGPVDIYYFLKRNFKEASANPDKRKYVSLLRKKSL